MKDKVRTEGESQRTKCKKTMNIIHIPEEEGQELISSSNPTDHQAEKDSAFDSIIVLRP